MPLTVETQPLGDTGSPLEWAVQALVMCTAFGVRKKKFTPRSNKEKSVQPLWDIQVRFWIAVLHGATNLFA